MIENQEKNNTVERSDDVEDPGTEGMSDVIDMSALEADARDAVDETIDSASLEVDEMEGEDTVIDMADLEAEGIEEEGEILDLTEITSTAAMEGDTILELTAAFRTEDDEDEEGIDLADTLEDESFFDLETADEGEPGLDLTEEEFDIDEEEFDMEQGDFIDDAGAAPTPAAEDIPETDDSMEDELLEKLDDYFGDEDEDEGLDAVAARPAKNIPESLGGDMALEPGQLEAALDRLVEKKFGAAIDHLLSEAVSRKVSEEIEALKTILLDSIKTRK